MTSYISVAVLVSLLACSCSTESEPSDGDVGRVPERGSRQRAVDAGPDVGSGADRRDEVGSDARDGLVASDRHDVGAEASSSDVGPEASLETVDTSSEARPVDSSSEARPADASPEARPADSLPEARPAEVGPEVKVCPAACYQGCNVGCGSDGQCVACSTCTCEVVTGSCRC